GDRARTCDVSDLADRAQRRGRLGERPSGVRLRGERLIEAELVGERRRAAGIELGVAREGRLELEAPGRRRRERRAVGEERTKLRERRADGLLVEGQALGGRELRHEAR